MTHTMNVSPDPLLEVRDLKTYFFLDEGTVKAVDGASLTVWRGRTLCVVGESGCGKSVMARSILQIVDPPGRIVSGEVLFHRRRATGNGQAIDEVIDLARLHPRGREIRQIRGKDIAMIFQEPMASLSPVHTIGDQIMENILLHQQVSKAEARNRTIELLRKVGIPRPEQRADEYPFQLSGGQRQRAMIAMALSCNPSLLIADEPTTALDVTTQAQILELMVQLKDEFGMSIMLITHDLGVVAEMADDVVVMYLGRIVERAGVDALFHDPKHPYTRALLRSIPKLGPKMRERLEAIKGMVPNPYNRPRGCTFHPRCPSFMSGVCDRVEPPPVLLEDGREVRCLLYGGAEATATGAPAVAPART
jgi:peptide/nickel transport system ATP-binding protein